MTWNFSDTMVSLPSGVGTAGFAYLKGIGFKITALRNIVDSTEHLDLFINSIIIGTGGTLAAILVKKLFQFTTHLWKEKKKKKTENE